jgi:hypothetical protein
VPKRKHYKLLSRIVMSLLYSSPTYANICKMSTFPFSTPISNNFLTLLIKLYLKLSSIISHKYYYNFMEYIKNLAKCVIHLIILIISASIKLHINNKSTNILIFLDTINHNFKPNSVHLVNVSPEIKNQLIPEIINTLTLKLKFIPIPENHLKNLIT